MFDPFEVVLLIAIGQALFTVVVLEFVKQKNREANRVLSGLILSACLMMAGRVFYSKIDVDWFWRIGVLADTTIFIFGPLVYLYLHRLLIKNKSSFLSFPHFIPAIAHLIFFFWTLTLSWEEFVQFYLQGRLKVAFFVIELSGIVSLFCYCLASWQVIKTVKKQEVSYFSFKLETLRYARFFLASLSLLLLFWCLSFSFAYTLKKPLVVFNYETMWICTCLFFYLIGFYSLTQPALFRIKIEKEVSSRQRMQEKEIASLKKALEIAIQTDKIHTQSDLSLGMLAKHINTSPNHLSWLLNEVYQQNFYTFINQHRLTEFEKRVKANEHKKQTILAIALDVGFNSKSTFNKFFKSSRKQTPSAFIKQLEISQ